MKEVLIYIFNHPWNIFSWFFIIYFLVYSLGFTSRDDTDSKVTKKRSGLSLYTDYGTGCQYLKAGLFSKMEPRLDKNGNHICVNDIKDK